MVPDLYIEARKLKGSLAATLCVSAPVMVALLLILILMKHKPMRWDECLRGAIGLWSFFVLPMTVTALTTLLAQIEHGPRAWDHILSLPVARWRLFTAKAVVTMTLIGLMSVVMLFGIRLSGWIIGEVMPAKLPAGPFPWSAGARLLGFIWAASFCMSMIQLWVALRFRSFVAPITLGIAGTFVAVMASDAKEGVYFPWLMPLNILVTDGGPASPALIYGVVGGAVVLMLMLAHLSRREV